MLLFKNYFSLSITYICFTMPALACYICYVLSMELNICGVITQSMGMQVFISIYGYVLKLLEVANL